MLVRQGCLLSMLLYNIAAEVLANSINADKRINGIQIGDHEIKIVNFADNTIIFLRRYITCLNRIQVISIKIPEVNFGNYILDNSKWDKICESVAKKSISGTD